MKPLIVGEAPGPRGDPEHPLEGRPAARLLECMGWTRGELEATDTGATLREMFTVRNLIDRPMERREGAKGCDWPKEEAKDSARMLAVLLEHDQRVVLLGKRAAAAFEAPDGYWVWRTKGVMVFAVIPHPSGIVRLWNDQVNRVRAGSVLWAALGKMPLV